MKKKLFALILAVIMVFASMSSAVFAEEGQATTYPNLSAAVYVDNSDCVHYSDAKISMKLMKGDAEITSIELKYDEEWGQYSFEGRVDGIDAIIDEIAGNTELMKEYSEWMADLETEEDFDILKKAGYDLVLTVEDNDPNHEFIVSELSSDIFTKQIIEEFTDSIANAVMVIIINSGTADEVKEVAKFFSGVDLVVKEGVAYIVYADGTEKAFGFTDLLSLFDNEDLVKEMELEEEDLADIKQYKEMMTAMEAGTYKGEVEISASLECECPKMVEYAVYHEYYDASGKYVAQVATDLEAVENSVIKSNDIKLLEKYGRETYASDGYVYLWNDKTNDWDWENPKTEFQVPSASEDEYIEVCVKYTATSASAVVESEVDDGEKGGKSPDTGDDFNILPFVAVMGLALLGMAVAVIRRRA